MIDIVTKRERKLIVALDNLFQEIGKTRVEHITPNREANNNRISAPIHSTESIRWFLWGLVMRKPKPMHIEIRREIAEIRRDQELKRPNEVAQMPQKREKVE